MIACCATGMGSGTCPEQPEKKIGVGCWMLIAKVCYQQRRPGVFVGFFWCLW